ncbi:MAG: ABC transporter substrate-binding protein [Proteobacteria bacterium]|nr:ABC transporter substrate-binding protein [Pseudomonadota bacterium]
MTTSHDTVSRRAALGLLGGAVSSASALLAPRQASAATTVRLASSKVPHWAAVWQIPKFMSGGVNVELIEFKTSSEMISALTAGSVDLAAIGYWQFVRMLDLNAKVKAISGVCSGGTRLVVRKGVAVRDWSDLRGKVCAVARGSTQDIQFLLALKNKGISVKDLQYKDLGGNLAVHITALQQGQTDVAAMWEPFASQVLENGIGTQFSTLYDESFRVNALLAGHDSYVDKNAAAVQAVVDALVKSTDRLNSSPSDFLEAAMAISGFPRKTMEMSNSNVFLEYVLRSDDANKLASAVLEFGYVRNDVRPKFTTALDYQFLMKATGKSRKELGA